MSASVVIVIPCLNEEITVGRVIDDFRRRLPNAEIVVFDNDSDDGTAEAAVAHGARVVFEPRRGKGFVVDRLLETIDADAYVIVDGDATYPADAVTELLDLVLSGRADMAVGARRRTPGSGSFPALHAFGNNLVRALVNQTFRSRLTDIMSGFRVFNRRVARCVPIMSGGFEVETELTIHCLYYNLRIVELQVPYEPRPEGSFSKLRTIRDGARVLAKLFSLARAYKPLTVFGALGMAFLALGVVAAIPLIQCYLEGGHGACRQAFGPVIAGFCLTLSFALIFVGVLLHAVNWRVKELHNVLTRTRLDVISSAANAISRASGAACKDHSGVTVAE